MTVLARTRTLLIAASALTVSLAACDPDPGTSPASEHSTPAASPSDSDCRHYLAFLGPVTGTASSADFSGDVLGGIKLALAQADGSGLCLKPAFDTQVTAPDDPGRAAELATEIVEDPSIIGVVGPSLSTEAIASGGIFATAGLPVISPSVGAVTMSQRGWKTWHRLVGTDAAQGVAAARFIHETLGAKRAVVVDDGSLYGRALATVVRRRLGDVLVDARTVDPGRKNPASVVAAVRSAHADAVYYAGYFPGAGALVKMLRAAGWEGRFLSGGGSNDPGFVSAAGVTAANGSVLTTSAGPPQQDFASAFFALNDRPAGVYSTHAYDATNVFLAALQAGRTTRADVNAFVSAYRGEGLGGPIAFTPRGDLRKSVIYAWTVTGGAIDLTTPKAIR